MTPTESLLELLDEVTDCDGGWRAICPAHADTRPSLSVSAGDDGRALVYCHAGCDTVDVVAAVDLELKDLFPANRPPPTGTSVAPTKGRAHATLDAVLASLEGQLGRHSGEWMYRDSTGDPVGAVVLWDRPDGKDIRPVARQADGWRVAAMAAPRPLYRLPDVTTATRVLVVEGEKVAEVARTLGFAATTAAGGAKAAAKTDWRPLAGKEVWILPDNDPPGAAYADDVVAILRTLRPAPVVKILTLTGLSEKGDLADWVATRGGYAADLATLRAEIEAIAAATNPEAESPEPDAVAAYEPFPVEALPDPVGRYVRRAATAIGCDTAAVALPLLVA